MIYIRKNNRLSFGRLLFVFSIMFLLAGLILYRAVEFQIIKREELQQKLLKQRETIVKLVPRRGRILDSRNNEIAVSVKVGSVFAHPRLISDKNGVARTIAGIIGMDVKDVKKIISKDKSFVWVKRQIPEEQAEEIRKMKIPGIDVVWEYKRYYPNKELASSLIGFTGWDSQGLEGIEYHFDSYLRSEPEYLYAEKDAYGEEIILEPWEKPLSGNDIILTIDTNIQFVVEDEILKVGESTRAKNAIGIVMDVTTGAILAMAQYPGFNPNSFKEYSSSRWRDLAVSGIFEPGSTFKIFLVAGALQSGIIRPETVIDCENGEFRISNDVVIHDVKKYSSLTVEDIIAYSSNIGAAKIAQKLGKEKYIQYINSFGFGSKTGIELPAEEDGLLRTVKKTTEVDNMIMGFGQGISVTPIQLITAFNAIVNDGILVKPFVVRSILSPEGQIIYNYLPQEGVRVVSEKVARQVRRMMAKVVQYGTGQSANISGYGSGGKTGTSQKIDPVTGSYSYEKFTSYFIGFTPLNSPRVSILIIVDEPEGVSYGGVVAAPVFKKIGERILPLLGVESEMASRTNGVLNVSDSIPDNQDTGVVNNTVTSDGQLKRMPDLKGLSYREVLNILSRNGISATLSGNGFVEEQTPPPGTIINTGTRCSVKLKPLI